MADAARCLWKPIKVASLHTYVVAIDAYTYLTEAHRLLAHHIATQTMRCNRRAKRRRAYGHACCSRQKEKREIPTTNLHHALYNTPHVRPASCSDDGAISGAYSTDLYHRPNEAQHDDRANRRPPFNSASTSESRMGSSWLGSTGTRHKPKTTVVYLIRDTRDKKLEATQNTPARPHTGYKQPHEGGGSLKQIPAPLLFSGNLRGSSSNTTPPGLHPRPRGRLPNPTALIFSAPPSRSVMGKNTGKAKSFFS